MNCANVFVFMLCIIKQGKMPVREVIEVLLRIEGDHDRFLPLTAVCTKAVWLSICDCSLALFPIYVLSLQQITISSPPSLHYSHGILLPSVTIVGLMLMQPLCSPSVVSAEGRRTNHAGGSSSVPL